MMDDLRLRLDGLPISGSPFARFAERADAAAPHPDRGRRAVVVGLGACCAFLVLMPGTGLGHSPSSQTETPVEKDMVARHAWLAEWVAQDGFDRKQLNQLLGSLTPHQRVLHLMDHQAESKPYYAYRALLINDNRIQRGRNRMRRHGILLRRIQWRYHVPREILTALWGLESDYGGNMGGFQVLRTLYTLAVHYPRRAVFFQSQLREFLLLCRDEGWDPRVPKGSYAGAMGQVQMIPGTMRRYAVDFDGDGKRDIFHKTADVLASIASFLEGHGWRPDGPIAMPVAPRPGLEQWVSPSLKEMRPWRQWRAEGIQPAPGVSEPGAEEPAALIMLAEETGPRYHMVFGNFRVITRWNRSARFAMVVRELAARLREVS